MNALNRMLAKARASQDGLTLIEVIVAVVVFAIISTGVAYTVVAVLNVTRQSSAREEATNLAAQDIDLDRSIANLFSLLSDTYTTKVNGVTYTVTRDVEWVTDSSVTAKCGTGGGNLEYKRVNVTVGWSGQSSSTAVVHADTVINPDTRINDGSHGTILVRVSDASGAGVSGVTVTAVPSAVPNGATTLTSTPAVTDNEGCSYILSVTPGTYDVKVSRSGYLAPNQASTVTVTTGVTASSAGSAPFEYNQAGNLAVTYPALTSIPNNLDTSYISTYGTYTTSAPVSPQPLYPFTGGYVAIAGDWDDPSLPGGGCASPDPAAWAAGTALDGTVVPAGARPQPMAAGPGLTSQPDPVPMGKFTIAGLTSGQFVTAVQVNGAAATGDPGCATANLSTYTFSKASTLPSLTAFALPYGTWKIYTGTSSGSLGSQVAISKLAVVGNHGGTQSSNGGTITLDPRGT